MVIIDSDTINASMFCIKGVAILDQNGKRIFAKYFDVDTLDTAKKQKEFEIKLHNKTHKANAEIIMMDGLTVVYRSNVDVFLYIMGSQQENELLLVSVLNCLYDSLSQIFRKNVEKRCLMDNLDAVILAIDEMIDSGIIMESDPSLIASRSVTRTSDDIPLGEQTVAQVLATAKEQIKWSLLK